MPEYLVLLLSQVTIFSSVTAVLLLAVKWIFRRRIPPMLSLLLWLILLVRVTLPMLPESAFSIYNLIPAGRVITYTLTHDYDQVTQVPEETEAENPYRFHGSDELLQAEPLPDASAEGTGQSPSIARIRNVERRFCIALLTVFACGVVLTGCIQWILYDRAIRRVCRSSCLCRDSRILQIYTETAADMRIMDKKAPPLRLGSTTMLAGLVRPCVILHPESAERELSESELRMVFLHELHHFKYMDNWILLLSTVVCVIFWYNPLLWLVRNMLREDIEVLCDARTLETCGNRDGEYARMLYRSSCRAGWEMDAGTAMSASGRKLKRRLLLISNRRKGVFLPRMVSVCLCAAMIAICLTNPIVSAESAYAPYIDRIAEITGTSARELTLNEQITVGTFLEQCGDVLEYAGGEELRRKAGGVTLDALAALSEQSPYVSAEIADAVARITQEEELTLESCSVLLTALTGILGEGRYLEIIPELPEMLSADAMETLCRNLTKEEAAAVQACYNIGVKGADVEFSHIYTEAMMKLILSRIQNSWAREKLGVYFQKVNLSGKNLDEINAYLAGTVRYVGIGRDFHICDPALSRYEEENIRDILGAAYAGEREDVYYLKKTEDNCSFAEAAEILAKAGMTWREIYDEYALLGETVYTCLPPDAFLSINGQPSISAWEAEEYLRILADAELTERFHTCFTYYETFTYTEADGSEDSVAMRYYVAEGENLKAGRRLLQNMLERLNAVAFAKQYDVESLSLYDTVSPAAEEACLLAADMGYLYFGRDPVSGQRQITSGQCARVLCRFLASMVNVY